jgi:hypothetical protein
VVWDRRHFPFSVSNQKEGNKKKAVEEEEEKEDKFDMVSTISFIQANIQHSIVPHSVG